MVVNEKIYFFIAIIVVIKVVVVALKDWNLITDMKPRLGMMNYQKLIEQDLVIATGIVEGAARYVIGERMDCSGIRWIPERAEALLRLKCIELNGDYSS